MTETDTNALLKTLIEKIDSLVPKPADPKEDAIKVAEGIIRKSLEGKIPDEKLATMKLDQLQMAADFVAMKLLPDPIGKEDNIEEEEDKPETVSKEDADRSKNPFKYASRDYDKEVNF